MTSNLSTDSGASGSPPALELGGLTKSFGATLAVDDVTLSIASGTIHSFVGENGAGKSTILGMIAGRLAPSSGTITSRGAAIEAGSPRSARAAGIVAIYQELTVIPTMTALANVFLPAPERRWGLLDGRTMRLRFAELAARVGAQIDPDAVARTLSVAQQQLLEVMRALDADARTIVFDEPTATLPSTERTRLLRLMEQLRAAGVTVIFVSHNLEEVLDISDHVTVFRDGRLVDSRAAAAWSKDRLIAAMLGDALAQRLHDEKHPHARALDTAPEALRCEQIGVPGVVHDVSLCVRRGEILGVAGLVGAGRSTLLRAIAGLEPSSSGRLTIGGRAGRMPHSVRAGLRSGIALLPEDRKTLGLIGSMTAADNVMISSLGRAARWGWVRRRSLERLATEASAPFGVRPEYLTRPARHLSGGNQQKLLLARWALRAPRVLLADEPTRGIDIGAKQQIRTALRALADAGMAIVMVSSEHEELLGVADRIVVLARGRLTAEFDNTARTVAEEQVLQAAFARELDNVG